MKLPFWLLPSASRWALRRVTSLSPKRTIYKVMLGTWAVTVALLPMWGVLALIEFFVSGQIEISPVFGLLMVPFGFLALFLSSLSLVVWIWSAVTARVTGVDQASDH